MGDDLVNEYGQPIGAPVAAAARPARPSRAEMEGRYCRLERLDAERHADTLYSAFAEDDRDWTYLPYGPFDGLDAYAEWMRGICLAEDRVAYAIADSATGSIGGMACYLRIDPGSFSIEVGSVHFAPRMQRNRVATEGMYLMMREAFGLGYRRYEWKCDSLNSRSRSAALRLGFSFEGVFRQAAVYKGRNRDTAWYSVIDSEWPSLEAAFLRWLDPSNFDAEGRQRASLSSITGLIAGNRG